MRGMQGAKLNVNGSLGPGNSKVDLKLVELPLAPFNAYVTPRGYSLAGGTLSLDTQGKVERDAYDSSSKVVISQLDVGGAQGEALFEENFGIPLAVALGLLKDLNGNIHLAVPVAGDRGGTRVGLASLVRQALSKALVGALASPLKLFGAVTADGKVQSLAPEPIAFATGSSQISEEGHARIEQLASLLTNSPGVALTLRGATSPEDERWVKEQALLEELRASSGLRALAMGKLGEIGTRTAVREHLEAQFAGQEKPLEPEAKAWLEAQLAQREADPARLAALAEARAAAARQALVSEYGIEPARLTLGPPESEAPKAVPGVVIALGASPRASP
jgi:outer membrane protein OmpA-like peptidoglycan-associated protein